MLIAFVVLLGAGLITAALDVGHAGVVATPFEALMWGSAGVVFARAFALPAVAIGVPVLVAVVELSTGGPGSVSAPAAPGDPLSLGLPLGGRLEVTEAVFAAAYGSWAARFGLRRSLTRLALVGGVLIAIGTALPGTALLSGIFLLVNADRLGPALSAPPEPRRRFWQRA